jgi:hypothetical protein
MKLIALLSLAFCALGVAMSKRMVGGREPVDLSSSVVLDVAQRIAREYDVNSPSQYKQGLVRVVEGTQQVVSGMSYDLTVELGESNCVRAWGGDAGRPGPHTPHLPACSPCAPTLLPTPHPHCTLRAAQGRCARGGRRHARCRPLPAH